MFTTTADGVSVACPRRPRACLETLRDGHGQRCVNYSSIAAPALVCHAEVLIRGNHYPSSECQDEYMQGGDRQEILLRLKLVGSQEAANSSGNNVLPPSRKARALLSYLALNADQWVSRARITRLLWDRVPE